LYSTKETELLFPDSPTDSSVIIEAVSTVSSCNEKFTGGWESAIDKNDTAAIMIVHRKNNSMVGCKFFVYKFWLFEE